MEILKLFPNGVSRRASGARQKARQKAPFVPLLFVIALPRSCHMKRFKVPLSRVVSLLALVGCAHMAAAQSVKIGVQLPLTGERADVGKLMQNGLQMALDKASRDSGQKFELVWEDDQSDSDAGVKALER